MQTPLSFQAWQQENPGTPGNWGDREITDRNNWWSDRMWNNAGYTRGQPTTYADYEHYLNNFAPTDPVNGNPAAPVLPTGTIANPPGNIENVWQPGVGEATQVFNQGIPDITSGLQGVVDNLNQDNPFIQGFQNFQSQANPYADELYNIGADQIRDRINSQFGMAGQGNSSLNLDAQLEALSPYTAQFYGGIYDAQQDRALRALQGGAGAFQGQQTTRGSLVPGILGAIQSQPYANLSNYTDIVSRLTGSAPYAGREPERASGFDRLLGLGTVLTPFFTGGFGP